MRLSSTLFFCKQSDTEFADVVTLHHVVKIKVSATFKILNLLKADFEEEQEAMKDCNLPELETQIDIDFFNLTFGRAISQKYGSYFLNLHIS